ncbi:MAG: flavodoxin family protein [Thermoproteota archaeon]
MVKVIIVYDSKYGNTKHVAETIMEGMREAQGVETWLSKVKDVSVEEAQGFDAILIGSPNHMGRPTGGVKSFIDKLGRLNPQGKMFAVFDTYLGNDFEKATGKMKKRIREKVPGLKQAVPGLSVRVKGMRGPVSENELPRCREYGIKMAAQLKTGG